MTIKHFHINDYSDIFLAEITETTDNMIIKFQNKLPDSFYKIKSEIHKKQFLAKLFLFKHLNIEDIIQKNENGKPFLIDGRYISISHSGKWVAVGISKKPIGIDIEHEREKLEKIASKFIHPNDFGFSKKLNNKKLLWYWTTKEAVYKLVGEKGLNFKNDIRITLLDINNKTGKVYVKKNNLKIDIIFKKTNDFYLLSIAQC